MIKINIIIFISMAKIVGHPKKKNNTGAGIAH